MYVNVFYTRLCFSFSPHASLFALGLQQKTQIGLGFVLHGAAIAESRNNTIYIYKYIRYVKHCSITFLLLNDIILFDLIELLPK